MGPGPVGPGPIRRIQELRCSPMNPSTSPGAPAVPDPVTVDLVIGGMHCASCVALVEESLGELDGVESVTVALEPGRASVGYRPGAVGVDDLCAAIAAVGYDASPAEAG